MYLPGGPGKGLRICVGGEGEKPQGADKPGLTDKGCTVLGPAEPGPSLNPSKDEQTELCLVVTGDHV